MSVATDVPLREQSHLNIQQSAHPDPVVEDRLCPGCKKSAVNEQGGLVVAFGSSFFHVDCFKCAKCHNQVTADTNLLLLSDGSPICANCSYSCNVCRQPILDEAIMAGEDSYHAHCFKCKVCKNRIDELVFAKTSQGIYCMKCHNERMIRIRKHAQKKADREKAQGGSGSSKSREREARNYHRENSPTKQHTLPVPNNGIGRNSRRSVSYDDGLKPVEGNPSEFGASPSSSSNSLSVTSRRDKRRSINPGLSLNPFNASSLSLATSTTSPRSETFHDARSTPPPQDQINDPRNAKRTSHADSMHSLHSLHSNHSKSRSPSPSITTQDYDQQDETVVLKSPILDTFNSTPNPGGPHGERMSAGLSPNDPRANFASQQRRPSLGTDTYRAGGSRSASPAYRADVPHSVESGTDTDDDGPDALPPAPPPKDPRIEAQAFEHRHSIDSQDGDTSLGKDDYSDAEIERNTHSTYIAPALPPIRVSLTSDLSDFLNGKSINDLANMNGLSSATPTGTAADGLANIDEEALTPDTPTAEDSSVGHGSSNNHTSESLPASNASTPATTANGLQSSKSSVVSQSTVVPPTVSVTGPRQKASGADIVTTRLREALENAKERGAQQLKLDRAFVEAILGALDQRTADLNQMKAKFDGVKRASKQYIEGFNVAQTEYDRELKLRRDAEAEVTRLRVLLSGQAARLSALSGDSKRQEVRQQMTKEISDSLTGLEQDFARLKAERDMTLAEMEELSASKSSGPDPAPANNLSRTLTKRLDNIKKEYQRDLIPLQKQREQLNREIAELKAVRDVFLEETAVLNARNEELAQLSAVYSRRMDPIPEAPPKSGNGDTLRGVTRPPVVQAQQSLAPSLSTSTSSTSTMYEEQFNQHVRAEITTPAKNKFKWPGTGSKTKEVTVSPSNGMEFSKSKAHIEHNFQQISLLNFTRCKHCGDKMWGSQLRCTVCSTSIHVRCIANVQIPCTQSAAAPPPREEAPAAPLPPSMFGRDLIEQVRADSKGGERRIPVIVEKCVDAVEALALDYEGIYRKTGGSGQQRAITALFERGDYAAFDLQDSDRFNDICSVTSVLKTYFRSLPVPLLTFDLHDQFISSMGIRDTEAKHQALVDLVNKLPTEHYYTLKKLMIHLHHVMLQSEVNRMTARNLGVVFGPTLMKSRDPSQEFSDMAGKALFIEWLIENAPVIFNESN
ncbi:signal transducer [Coprinopsis cinerea okayama7|uniref:Signal transducer n=1 Tax=Coprinopsis cinerea (strain Okayama-7 / 130 / ATCC MYA-4618 / FGSC 9003) TaxID=240176 RepID=A8N6T8_COPC7|nr:signal transducer [Coprinopsis cinerea okayama7\|eukprot:XP_001830544.2 signal transducer [Coprinopsis cinerea okayama7\